MIYLKCYILIGILYGFYTVYRINQKWIGIDVSHYVMNFLFSVIVWPLSIFVAIKKKDLWKQPGEIRSYPSCKIKTNK